MNLDKRNWKTNYKLNTSKAEAQELQQRVDQMKQFSRRNNLRIYEIPEHLHEDREKVVCDLIEDKLYVKLNNNAVDI